MGTEWSPPALVNGGGRTTAFIYLQGGWLTASSFRLMEGGSGLTTSSNVLNAHDGAGVAISSTVLLDWTRHLHLLRFLNGMGMATSSTLTGEGTTPPPLLLMRGMRGHINLFLFLWEGSETEWLPPRVVHREGACSPPSFLLLR